MMDLVVALRAFGRTLERGSVTAAARDLGVSQPAITKHLRNLERHVGARLLERSARAVRPTPQGQALYDATHAALATIDSAIEGVRGEVTGVQGPLRIHAPSCLGAKHLHPIVLSFQEAFPDVIVDLVLDNRKVDLVYENFDMAIVYGRPAGQELVIRRVGSVQRLLVAAPAFLDRVGPIETIEHLANIPIVTTSSLLSTRDRLTLLGRKGAVDVSVRAVMRTNNADVIVRTLREARAAGPVQRLLVDEELRTGQLVHILPAYEVKPTEAYVVYPSVRFMRPAVRAFTDFAIPALRAVEGIVHRSAQKAA